jgi:DNA-binding MarR family transcriptional regulator
MESRGLVKRIADLRDRRVIRVRLTEDGMKLRTEAVPAHCRFIAETLAALTDAETGHLLHLIGKIEEICDVRTNP